MKTILVIDDSPDNISYLFGILEDDYKIKAAINGNIGLKIINSNDVPDLVLLDIIMPEVDGFEICKKIRANSLVKNLPIIFLSADDNSKIRDKAKQFGGNDFIKKPIDPELLKNTLKRYL